MTCERDGIEARVLERARPSRVQLAILDRFYRILEARLRMCLNQWGLEGVVEAEGSYAKGTLLSDKWELDVFVLIKAGKDWIRANARRMLESCLADMPHIAKYSEHPYITVSLMGLEADIVPARLLDRPDTRDVMGVERTPFHTRYVRDEIARNPCLADDVRLMKSFLKGIRVYGAETARGGFSGYLAEVLTIAYGGFKGALREIASWRPPVYLDPGGWGTLDEVRRRYRDSLLVVVDPVDPYRNVAAAVRGESLYTLILAARLYHESPSRLFFHVFQGEARRLEEEYRPRVPLAGVVAVYEGRMYEYPPQDVEGQLYRISRSLGEGLEREGFKVYKTGWSLEAWKGIVYAIVEATSLPPSSPAIGPGLWASTGRLLGFISKRLREGGAVLPGRPELYGVAARRDTSLASMAERILARLKPPRGARLAGVEACWVGECSGQAGRVLSEASRMTPAWIIQAYTRSRG